jgi:hypothetical protein
MRFSLSLAKEGWMETTPENQLSIIPSQNK